MRKHVLVVIIMLALVLNFVSCKRGPSQQEIIIQRLTNEIIPQLNAIKKEKENLERAKTDLQAKITEIDASIKSLDTKLNALSKTVNEILDLTQPKVTAKSKFFKWALTYLVVIIVIFIVVFIWIRINKQKKDLESEETDWEEIPSGKEPKSEKEENIKKE